MTTTEKASTGGAPRRPGSRTWRWLGGGAAALLLLWGVGWLWLPGWAKAQAEARGSAVLGRSVRIEALEFQPWALTLTVRGVSVGAAGDAGEPQLRIARLFADLDARSLWERAPVVKALQVEAPQLRLARTAEGRYDIDDLLQRFAPDPAAPPSAPARFALYNVEITGGALRFDDQPHGRVHEVQALHLSLPFLSNLPSQVDVKVEPRLAFRFDGAQFDTGGQATPFAQTRQAELNFELKGLDLGPWRAYLPADLPLHVVAGRLDSKLALRFAQPAGAAPQLVLSGQLGLADVGLAPPSAPASAPAPLQWRQLTLALGDVQPLARQVKLESLRIEGLAVQARRDARGGLNLWRAPSAKPAAAPPPPAPAASAAAPWQLALQTLDVDGARIGWEDATVAPSAQLGLAELKLQAQGLAWPQAQPAKLRLATGFLAGPQAQSAGRLSAEGELAAQGVTLQAALDDLRLEALAPYLAAHLTPRVSGTASARVNADWGFAEGAKQQVTLPGVAVRDLRVVEPRTTAPALGWRTLELSDLALDLPARQVKLGQVRLLQPVAQMARDAQGQLNLATWFKPAPAGAPAAPAAGPSAPWQVAVADARVEGGALRWRDAATGATPVALDVQGLQAQFQEIRWPGGEKAAPWKTRLTATLGAPGTERRSTARIDWQGRVLPEPLRAEGRLAVERFPVHAFAPYVDGMLPVSLLRADAGWKGDLSLRQAAAGLTASLRGDALLADLHVAPRQGGEELVSWQSLALQGVQVAVAPGARPRVEIGEAALTDFFARLLVTEQGRFNLQDMGAPTPPPAPPLTPPGAAASAPVAVAAAPASASAPASAPAASAEPLPLDLVVGRTRLVNGRIDFADRFIRPNYNADLTELNGTLGRVDSNSPQLAALELRGKAAGTAQLEITGELNPAARPLALDIRARATDLELAPFSPYAGKYAGYAIERGKLSMDVAYKVQPDGRLDARNQVILNQLTFGEKVDSPDATKLPVLLAVALLKDRNGVIDINLPVSGSLNDPQFSVGGIVLKVIVNLLVKAVTAPFALLGGGGGEELSYAEFRPGTAQLNDAGAGVIAKVAQALIDRPSLKMTVTGAADPQSEREAIEAAALEARIQAEYRKERLRGGAASDETPPPLSAEQRAALVKQIYGDTKLPNKPRNAIGLAKTLPTAEMEALLRAATLVTADGARQLALQRGLAVRDALVAKGLPGERLFLAAPRLRASGEDDATWTPRVQLTLATN